MLDVHKPLQHYQTLIHCFKKYDNPKTEDDQLLRWVGTLLGK